MTTKPRKSTKVQNLDKFVNSGRTKFVSDRFQPDYACVLWAVAVFHVQVLPALFEEEKNLKMLHIEQISEKVSRSKCDFRRTLN